MKNLRIVVQDDNDEIYGYEESVPDCTSDDLAYFIACGLLHDSSWIPGSLSCLEITLDGRKIDCEDKI